MVQALTGKGVRVEFGKVFTGNDSPMATWGAFTEFERSLIKERSGEGIALAKQCGIYKGRKRTLGPQQAVELPR